MDQKSAVYLWFGWILIIFSIVFLFFPLSSYQSGIPFYDAASGTCSTSGGTNFGEILTEWIILLLIAIGIFMLVAYHYADKPISLTGDINSSVNGITSLFDNSNVNY